jgi:hypothetical protein
VRYLDEAERMPEAHAQRAYLERYGIGFWRIIARKPGAGAPARRHATEQQLYYVGPG